MNTWGIIMQFRKQISYSILSKATVECGILIHKAKTSFPATVYVLCVCVCVCVYTHTHTYINE